MQPQETFVLLSQQHHIIRRQKTCSHRSKSIAQQIEQPRSRRRTICYEHQDIMNQLWSLFLEVIIFNIAIFLLKFYFRSQFPVEFHFPFCFGFLLTLFCKWIIIERFLLFYIFNGTLNYCFFIINVCIETSSLECQWCNYFHVCVVCLAPILSKNVEIYIFFIPFL